MDRGLVARTDAHRMGDEEAFAQLIGDHLRDGYRLAYALLGNGPDAEDATQDAAETAWRRWRTLRDLTRFDAWFDTILVNRCRDRIRRSRRIRFVPIVEADDATATSENAANDLADRDLVARAAQSLSFDQRATIVLRYWADLPVEAIAARLGVPIGTVKSRLNSASTVLRKALNEYPSGRGGPER